MKQSWTWMLGGITGMCLLGAIGFLTLDEMGEGIYRSFSACQVASWWACFQAMDQTTKVGVTTEAFLIVGSLLAGLLFVRQLSNLARDSNVDRRERKLADTGIPSETPKSLVVSKGSHLTIVAEAGAVVNLITESGASHRDSRYGDHDEPRLLN